jgi:hypothetical protein
LSRGSREPPPPGSTVPGPRTRLHGETSEADEKPWLRLIRSSSHLVAVVVVGILAVATSLGLIVVTSPRAPSGSTTGSPGPATLELVALEHEADGARMTVRGVVRNPASGTDLEHLTAVVVVGDSNGGFLASGSATIDAPTLGPGSESTFLVTVPRTGEMGRYRVSFQSGGRVVPHVDRRARGSLGSVVQSK